MRNGPEHNRGQTPKVFYVGTCVASIVIALPLIGHQLPNPRSGFFWYPIFLVALALLVAWGMTRVSGLGGRGGAPFKPFQVVLVTVGCFTAGFFAPWFATIGPEMLGPDAWRGNVLTANVLSAVTGLLSGFWIAVTLRLLRGSVTAGRALLVMTGCIAIQCLWAFSEKVNEVPWFWIMLEALSQRYAAYFLFEAIAGQVAWPLALLTCGCVCVLGKGDQGDDSYTPKSSHAWSADAAAPYAIEDKESARSQGQTTTRPKAEEGEHKDVNEQDKTERNLSVDSDHAEQPVGDVVWHTCGHCGSDVILMSDGRCPHCKHDVQR